MPSTRATARSSSANVTSSQHVRVDGLAEQHDLAIAGVGELADLAQHLARRRAALAAARERHHAERAELVAAALDRDEARDAVAADRARQALVGLGLVELDVDSSGCAARRARPRAARASGDS